MVVKPRRRYMAAFTRLFGEMDDGRCNGFTQRTCRSYN